MIMKTVNGVRVIRFRLKEDIIRDMYRLFTNGEYKITNIEVTNGTYVIDAKLSK